MTFEEASLLPRSEKITLVTIDSFKAVKIFTLDAGSIYYRDVEYFVNKVKQDDATLTEVNSYASLSTGEWYFDKVLKRLYVWMSDSSNPKTKAVTIGHRHFFSNAPVVLPCDLANGSDVEWLPYINSVSSIGQQLDDENTGIVLESSSSVDLINSHGYFDDLFDTLIFENKTVEFYTWFPQTPISEARKIFSGVVESKDFAEDKVIIKVKDFVYRLRNFVNLGAFSETDGKISDSLLGSPKRRIYGQAKQVQLSGIDSVLSGYTASGTVSISVDTNIMTGTGTDFLNELSVGDEIVFTVAGTEYKFGIESISDATNAIINKDADVNIVNQPLVVSPVVPYREYNRNWHIAGHKLREPTTVITSVIASNRFLVSSAEDIFSGDQILINGDLITVRRVTSNEIVTQSAVSPVPSVSDTVKKLPIQRVFFGPKELIYSRDWSYTNSTESKIAINSLAEFNITQERTLSALLTFTNASRIITTASSVDLRSILKPRDWIRKNTILSGENDWYEILSVDPQGVTLRTPFTGTSGSISSVVKSVEYISDDSLITADCLGMEVSGSWMKRPADAVRNLILSDAGFSLVNESSFDKAKADCDYILSVIIPEYVGSDPPTISDVITKINESCFGSLYGNSTLDISYSILNSDKPDLDRIIKDDDILGFSAESTTEIYNVSQVFYRPYTDLFTGEVSFKTASFNSGFVDRYVGITNRLEKTIYLYEDDKAEIIAQRYSLFKSLTNTKVTVKGKMLFFLNAVNDKVFLSLDRLYKRFGGEDRRKIGIITGIKKSQAEVELVFSDMGNIFNRVPSICPNVANDFLLADNDERVQYGYIVDDVVLTPDPTSEAYSNCNIVG